MSNESLWEFALSTYATPGIEPLCLELQDREGININLLLWSLWLDRRKLAVDEDFWQQAIRTIAAPHRRTVCVRSVRRILPKWAGLLWLRNRVKALELQLEKVELLKLQQLTESYPLIAVSESGQSDGYLRLGLKAVASREDWLQQLQNHLD